MNPDQVAQVRGGAYLIMPDPELVDASLIEDALKTTLADSHLGWKLVNTVKRVLGHRGGAGLRDASEPLLKLVKALCAPVPPAHQITMLKVLAQSRPGKESPGGHLFRELLDCFAKTDEFFKRVLSEIELPTQDGNWHASRDVARSESGVARRHRLIYELRTSLRLNGDEPVPQTNNVKGGECRTGPDALKALEKYFESWRERVSPSAVGAFLSLLGDGLRGSTANLAQRWLGEDVSLKGLRSMLAAANGSVPFARVNVSVKPDFARGNRVIAMNVVGSWVEMEADADNETLFAVDPVNYPPSRLSALAEFGGPFWEITLRDVEPQSRTRSDLTGLLGNTVERWAVQFLKLDREQVNHWWSQWGTGSQANLGPVLASIRAHLPLTFRQLDVQEREPLRDALREAEQAQRKREQAHSRQSEATLKAERESLDRLAKLIEEPEHQTFLWERVNELMRRYGYGPESVLLELAQNADDALAQAAEIKGGPLPPATCRLLIRVHVHDGTPTLDITHWGRSINDTGGPGFPEGRERQWDQDLYFMMLMNLSGKPGEAPGRAASASTTGRFGLGFKSIHLVSESPSVVSGFINFSIAGGLLPQERQVADDADSWMVEDRRATRVRLPLRGDVDAHTLIERLFHRFAYARALLPVFARQLREVVVECDSFAGVHVFDGKPIAGAPGWSVGAETELPNHEGRWRVLRFRPADAGHEGMGTAALAVGLREGVPTPFDLEMPFLWNVAPTSESWGCGYAVNGPFKLDPGRTHMSLDDDATLRVAGGLGDALGKGLIQLHDALVCPTDEVRRLLDHGDSRSFLTALWKVLASGLNNPDELRREFLLRLHGNDRGLSAWTAARPAVPSGLPAPFTPVLPPLTTNTRLEVADGGLANADFCYALAEINDKDFAALVDDHCIVSAEVAQLLGPLCGTADTERHYIAPTRLRPSNLFAKLAKRWDHCLSPERLHALRPLASNEAWGFVESNFQGVTWQAQAADGSLQPLRNLLLRQLPKSFDDTDAEVKDELLRAAFAPDDRVLDPAYIECSEDWRVFRWLRVQHRVDATMIADWYTGLAEDLQPAAVCYLLDGELQVPVLTHLVPLNTRPSWLQEYDQVCAVLEELGEEPWRCQSLLGALFPDRFRSPELPQPPREPERFFERLLEWWDDDAERGKVVADYERRAWPTWLRKDGIADGLTADSQDHWLALLVLGACQSLGRTQRWNNTVDSSSWLTTRVGGMCSKPPVTTRLG